MKAVNILSSSAECIVNDDIANEVKGIIAKPSANKWRESGIVCQQMKYDFCLF